MWYTPCISNTLSDILTCVPTYTPPYTISSLQKPCFQAPVFFILYPPNLSHNTFMVFLSFFRQSHSKRKVLEAEMWGENRILINEDRNASTVRKPNISIPLGTVVPAQMGNQVADSSRKVYTHGIHHNPIVKGHWISLQFPASLVFTSQQPALCPRFLVC